MDRARGACSARLVDAGLEPLRAGSLDPLGANHEGVRLRLKELRRGPEDLPRGSNDCPADHVVRKRANPDAEAKWDLLAQHENPGPASVFPASPPGYVRPAVLFATSREVGRA
jgi:hypothetical protein